MFYVYVLEAEDGDLYTGFTTNLRKRLQEHNQKQSAYTRRRKQWKCVYYEACLHREDARRREKYLKTTQGSRLLKRRLKEYLYHRRFAS